MYDIQYLPSYCCSSLDHDPESIKGSPQVITALAESLAQRARSLNFAGIISPKHALINLLVALAFGIGLGAYACSAPADFQQLVKRFLNPFAPIPRPSTVKLQIHPGDAIIETGSRVKLTIDVFGRRVNKAIIYFSTDHQPMRRLEIPAPPETTAVPAVKPVNPAKLAVVSTPPATQETSSITVLPNTTSAKASAPPAIVKPVEPPTVPTQAKPTDPSSSLPSPGTPAPLQRLELILPAVQSNATYQIRAGDAESRPYYLSTERGPRLSNFTITYTFPEYTQLPPKIVTAENADIVALCGSRVTIAGHATKPLASAVMELNGAAARPLKLTNDGRQLLADLAVDHEGEFKFRLTDTFNFKNDDTLSYKIKLQIDQPPTVKLLDPDQDLEIDNLKPLELRFEASDDFGIASACLLHNMKREPIPTDGSAEFNLAAAGYRPGDEITYWIEVTDTSPARQIGRSEQRKLRLTETPELSLSDKGLADLRQLRLAIAQANQLMANARAKLKRIELGLQSGTSPGPTLQALREELNAAWVTSQRALAAVTACSTQPHSQRIQHDLGNILNLLDQSNDQLTLAQTGSAALTRSRDPAATLDQLKPALVRPANLLAWLAQAVDQLQDAREIEALSQFSRRIYRVEEHLLARALGTTAQWKQKAETDIEQQSVITTASGQLSSALLAGDNLTPASALALRLVAGSFTTNCLPHLTAAQQWFANGKTNALSRDSFDPLMSGLDTTRTSLRKREHDVAETATVVRGQFERGRLELSQHVGAVAQMSGERFPDVTSRSGLWRINTLLVPSPLNSLIFSVSL